MGQGRLKETMAMNKEEKYIIEAALDMYESMAGQFMDYDAYQHLRIQLKQIRDKLELK